MEFILINLLVIFLIGLLVYYQFEKKKAYRSCEIYLKELDARISNIETVEDCDKVQERINYLCSKTSASFNDIYDKYLVRFYMVDGIRYLLIKQNKDK